MAKKSLTLPPTKYGDFWEDAEIIKVEPQIQTTSQVHSWRQEGSYAVCTTCPTQHGIFIDVLTQEVREGNVVDKKTNKVIIGLLNNQKVSN